MTQQAIDTPSDALHPSIVRAYDIRGIVGETLFVQNAHAIGRAFATYVSQQLGVESPKVCVGFDGRLSSPELEEALVKGLIAAGADVLRVGRGPTPKLYYATRVLQADAGIMVTGSHNPPSHNGFKMMMAKLPLHGEQIEAIGKIVAEGTYRHGTGVVSFEDIEDDYLQALVSAYEADKRPLKVAWDAGNGAGGEVLETLVAQLPGEHIVVNSEIDGTFPAHHPDPSVPENLEQIAEIVKTQGCDIGLAFDGDADRVGAVDNQGKMISGDHLMMMFSRHILKKHPGGTVIADVKTSQLVFDDIADHGGEPLMWKTGHSLIKTKMAELDAVFAGEMSGHIFFKEHYCFDDGLYAAVQLLNIAAGLSTSLSDYIDQLPENKSTPELRVEVSEERKFTVVEEIDARLREQGADVNDIDGVRVNHPYGWWLLRASNTQAVLVARCESSTDDGLEKLKAELKSQLDTSGLEWKLTSH
jgi:phosphomannomutase